MSRSHASPVVLTLLALALPCAGQEPPPAPPTADPAHPAHTAPPVVVAADTVVTRDVPYTTDDGADGAAQRLDVYAPRGAAGLPVVLFVHGGGWNHGDKAEVGAQPKLFNEHGIVLVSLNYRLSPPHLHPAHANDVADAVAWAREHIARYGGDGQRLVLMGHSAGSHVVSFVATDPRPLARRGLRLSDLRGTISLDGSAFDIAERVEKGGEKLAANCRRAFGDDPAAHRDGSPLEHVQADAGIAPFLVVYVKAGTLNHAQSVTFAERLRACGGDARLLHVEGKTHKSLVEDLGTERDAGGRDLVEFVRAVTAS